MRRKSSSSSPSTQSYPSHPFLLSIDEIISFLGTNIDTGLSTQQVSSLQTRYGHNKLSGEGGVTWYSVLVKQVSNAMILVLVLAMALAYGVSDYIEGGVITAVIIGNILIGFYQEYRAEQKMDALRSLSSPSATVIRNGEVVTIPSLEVVPGDVVLVKTGDTVPADLRLVSGMNLECDEKILTGEAIPVAKDTAFDHKTLVEDPSKNAETHIGIGDRLNMVYSSSTVTKGRGKGIVVYTGMYTEIGKIASSMQGKKRQPNGSKNRSMSFKKYGPLQVFQGGVLRSWDALGRFLGLTTGTPLQRKLSKLAYSLFGLAIVFAIIVFGVNEFHVTNEVAIYAISTGIAIIPESLIAVLTITMVVGMTQMHKRRVVIRQLSALEALGGVTNICSDKTGTLTQGQMVTRKAWIPGVGIYSVNKSDDASDPSRGFVTLDSASSEKAEAEAEKQNKKTQTSPTDSKEEQAITEVNSGLEEFLLACSLCNLATVRYDSTAGKWQTMGDPTEIALQVFAHRFGYGKKTLEADLKWKQIAEYPFDSAIKRMSVIYSKGTDEPVIFVKGAVERIIDLCTSVGRGNYEEKLTSGLRANILEQMKSLADQGLRVLAVAQRPVPVGYRKGDEPAREDVENELKLLGLAGLYDPPRLETKDAIKECTNAGIRVHMLTGDHPSTASAIAKEVGIIPRYTESLSAEKAASLVKTAAEFDSMTDDEIDAMPTLPVVIARCAPDTKTRMIAALHRRQCFAAMTGDGVNDAPSLQAADVGIAMGMGGSDVAKSASDIVLTDDNFASIVNAVEEGRRMFDNIQKFVLHLLASNVAEVVLLIVGLAFQDNDGVSVFPLSPLQILWINMLTSSFPAFGLGREKASASVMRRPPHDMKKGVFTWQVIVDMVVYGMIMGTLTLLTFVIVVYGAGNGTPDLGFDCNRKDSESCYVVFRARAAVFAELTWLILISAWEIKSLRNSMFNLDPLRAGRDNVKFPFFRDVWENKFLFWAVVIGALSVFPAVYIPGLNTDVFKHRGITWEWGLSFGAIIIFILGAEAWKGVKRRTGWFREHDVREYASVSESEFGLQSSVSAARSMTKDSRSTSA